MIGNIEGLYAVGADRQEEVYSVLFDAMRDYPKLARAYADKSTRVAGIEATIRYYGAFDMYYGKAFSLDGDIKDCIMILESGEMDYSLKRIEQAGCESHKWKETMDKMSLENRKKWFDIFDELDTLEAGIRGIPDKCLYVDFFGVKTEAQGRGRGCKIMEKVCAYADMRSLPIMLFTNTDYDIRFYSKNDFEIVGIAVSDKFGFENTYMVRNPK